jgi:hypothetical protein
MAAQTPGELAVSTATRRAFWIWSILAALIVGSMALAVWKAESRSAAMSAAAMSSGAAAVAPGADVKWVLEISAVDPAGIVQGTVLDGKTETIYQRSTLRVIVHERVQTSFVMGGLADLRPGALAHVTGKLRSDRAVDADKIVILSGFVQVRDASDSRP